MATDWTTFYRWEWFRRAQWLPQLRRTMSDLAKGSIAEFKRALGPRTDGPVLDCSCGFGRKTLAMKDMGMNVAGSDGCAFAVERAHEIAGSLGMDVEFFAADWAALPRETPRRFEGIFNDALIWTPSEEELVSALAGMRETLTPGGKLLFMGAIQGTSLAEGEEFRRKAQAAATEFALEWYHTEGSKRVTCLVVRDTGTDFIDEHRLYAVEESGAVHLDTCTIRHALNWHWLVLERLFRQAGYSDLQTVKTVRTREGLPVGINIGVR